MRRRIPLRPGTTYSGCLTVAPDDGGVEYYRRDGAHIRLRHFEKAVRYAPAPLPPTPRAQRMSHVRTSHRLLRGGDDPLRDSARHVVLRESVRDSRAQRVGGGGYPGADR